MKIFLELLVENLISRNIKKALLILDSWPGHKNGSIWTDILEKYSSKIELYKKIIPAGCTGKVQPLDVHYFRSYKDFLKHISGSLEIQDEIHTRANMFALQSFAHFQFRAPIFRNLIKYAFFKAGYYDQHPGPFDPPKKWCCEVNALGDCAYEGCVSRARLRCAHCNSNLCYQHAFLKVLHINCTQY